MHTVVRRYSGTGAAEVITLITSSKPAIEGLMKSVKGFRSYSVVKTEDGGFTVTVCDSEAASSEITAKARDWISENAGYIGAAPPTVLGGDITMHIA